MSAERDQIVAVLSSMAAGDEPVRLALVFPDGGVSLTIEGRPVIEGLADYLEANLLAARPAPEPLDADRLARAMQEETGVAWPKRWGPVDFQWAARQVAAAYREAQ